MCTPATSSAMVHSRAPAASQTSAAWTTPRFGAWDSTPQAVVEQYAGARLPPQQRVPFTYRSLSAHTSGSAAPAAAHGVPVEVASSWQDRLEPQLVDSAASAHPMTPSAQISQSPPASTWNPHGVDPKSGPTHKGPYRDFQSNCWVNLRILGQPCAFYLSVGRRAELNVRVALARRRAVRVRAGHLG